LGRQPNGRAGIKQGDDERYHTWVTIGIRPDGQPRRRHISGKTATEVAKRVTEILERQNRGGEPVKIDTVGDWLTYWIENVVKPNRAYNTYEAYRPIIYRHVLPEIGGYRLDGHRHRLEPEHVETMYTRLGRTLAPSYVLQVHRVLRKALKDALRRGRCSRNVCDLIDSPKARQAHVASLSLSDAQAVITAAVDDDMAPRWLLGMLLGLRQGEVLGLRWHRVDLEAGQLWAIKQAQRQAWQHGCDEPHACALRNCRTRPCPQGCRRHKSVNGCPPVCAPDCTGHARACPLRHSGGVVEVDTKSETGKESGIPLDGRLVESLRGWRERQIRERAQLGVVWDPQGLVFTSFEGKPLDARRDHDRWEKLLERAGVADRELHAARHTAGTLMVASGTDISVVQEILRHADVRTTRRYVDVANDLKKQAVEKIAASLFDGALGDLLRPASDRK
jgi:integrase